MTTPNGAGAGPSKKSNPYIMDTETVWSGQFLTMEHRRIMTKDGERNWEVCRRIGGMAAAGVWAETSAGEVILIKQYRPALDKYIIELPAGLIDKPDEDPAETVRREMAEETGYQLGEVRPIITAWSSPGMSDEHIHLYYGEIVGKGEAHPEPGEEIGVFDPIPRSELASFFRDRTQEGMVVDFKIYALWGYLEQIDGQNS